MPHSRIRGGPAKGHGRPQCAALRHVNRYALALQAMQSLALKLSPIEPGLCAQ